MATKKVKKQITTPPPPPPCFSCRLIWDLSSKTRDPGWLKIRIRDKYPGSAIIACISPEHTGIAKCYGTGTGIQVVID
jgi:hypothetical protein